MDIQNIIIPFLAVACTTSTTFFAIQAWFILRKQRRDIRELKNTQVKNFGVTILLKLQDDFRRVTEKKQIAKEFAERERFEEAQRMTEIIAKEEERLKKEIQSFNEQFKGIAEIHIEAF